jgi:hypothetical protein
MARDCRHLRDPGSHRAGADNRDLGGSRERQVERSGRAHLVTEIAVIDGCAERASSAS